jgi:hypothetical protein
MPNLEKQMTNRIARLSDANLDKELAFAEGFDDPAVPEENMDLWLALLRAEKGRRS